MINIDQNSGITVYIRLQGEANNNGASALKQQQSACLLQYKLQTTQELLD